MSILPAFICDQLYCVNFNYTYRARTWLVWFSLNGTLSLLQVLGEAFTNNIHQKYFTLRTHHRSHFKSWISGHSSAKHTLGRDFLAWLDNSALYF